MQIAVDAAGFTPAESDQLRRAMSSKRSLERMQELRERLFSGMAERGITGAVAEEIYEKLRGFADFGFPESHAYSFAYLVYASAWLKVHHPAIFYAALLAAQPMGFYSPQTLVADARRRGIKTLRPCVQASGAKAGVERGVDRGVEREFEYGVERSIAGHVVEREHVEREHSRLEHSIEDDGALRVRMGLDSVRGLGKDADKIIAARAAGAFHSPADLARRVGLSAAQLEALATAGALECFGLERRAALWQAGAVASERADRLSGTAVGVEAPTLPGLSDVELDVADMWATGVSPESYPTSHRRPDLMKRGILSVAEVIATPDGRRVRVGGVVTHRQRPATAVGVTFISLEDETGLLNIVCSVGLWARFRHIAQGSGALVVRGVVEHGDGAVNLVADHLEPLKLHLAGRSRDFR